MFIFYFYRNPEEAPNQQQEISQRVEMTRIPPTQVPVTTTVKSKIEKEILPQVEPTKTTAGTYIEILY